MADAGELVVRLRAEIAEFQKNFATAQKTLAQFAVSVNAAASETSVTFGRMGTSTAAGLSRFERGLIGVRTALAGLGAVGAGATASLAAFSTRALGPLAGFLTLAAAINKTKQSLKDFDDIFLTAKTAGVGTDLFQALGHRASEFGLSIDDVSAALTTFAKNSSQAANGIGRMRTQLGALDPRLLQQIVAAHGDQEKRLRAVADALDRVKAKYGEAGAAALQAAISQATFGSEEFGRLFEGGAKSIDAAIAEARKLGIIVSHDLLAGAHQTNVEFTRVSEILDLQVKTALVHLAPPMVTFLSLINDSIHLFSQIPGLAQKIVGGVDLVGLAAQGKQIDGTIAGIEKSMTDLSNTSSRVRGDAAKALASQVAGLQTLAAGYVQTYQTIGDIALAQATAGGEGEKAIFDKFIEGLKAKIVEVGVTFRKMHAEVTAGLIPTSATKGEDDLLQGLLDLLEKITAQARAAGLAIGGMPAPNAGPAGGLPTVSNLGVPSTGGLVRVIDEKTGVGVTRLESALEKGDAAIVTHMDNTMNVSKAIASGVDASNSSLDSIDTGQGRGFSSVVSALASLGSSLGSSFQTAMAGANGGFTAPPGTYAPSGTTGFAGDVFGTGEIPNPAYTAIQKNVQQAQAELDYLGTVLQYQQVSVSQQQAINLRMAALQLEIAKSNMSLSRMSSILYSNGYYSWVPPGYQDPSLVDTAGHHFTSYATGGAFKVGGSGGQDSQKVSFWASPDETVAVFTPEQWKKQGRYLARVLDEMTTGGPRAKDGTPAYAQGGFYRSGRPANDDRPANVSAPVSFFGGINIINTGGSDTRSRFAIEQDFGAMVRRTLRGRV